jgi:hypothetical protein
MDQSLRMSFNSSRRKKSVYFLFDCRAWIVTLFLSTAILCSSVLAQPSCSQVFLIAPSQNEISRQLLVSEHEELSEQSQNLRLHLEKGNDALTRTQLDALYQNFQQWSALTRKSLEFVGEKMLKEKLSESERTETLEVLQSYYRSYVTSISPIYKNLKLRRILDRTNEKGTSFSISSLNQQILSKEVFRFYQDLLQQIGKNIG